MTEEADPAADIGTVVSKRGEYNRLSDLPPERWEEIRKELPGLLAEIGPTIPNQLAHLPAATARPELVVAYLHRDGAVIIDNAVSEEVCDATVREMQPYIDETNLGKNDFLGKTTKRVGALVARSKASWEMIAHPLLMETCAGVLQHQLLHEIPAKGWGNAPGYEGQPWQLHVTQIIQIGAGEAAQTLHRDRWAFVNELAFTGANLEPEIGTIWALTDFPLEKGPTRVVPGSHRWPVDRPKPTGEQAAHAVMTKGSVVIYTGSVYHSGGNNVSAVPRTGLNVEYNLAWLTQEENQFLVCPPSVAKDLPMKLQDLVGYTANPSGYYDGFLSPKKSFAERPVNWASTSWQAQGPATGWRAQGPPSGSKSKL